MKIIIFAGGTGKRFWPVSKKASPKQFLPIVEDKPLIKLRYDLLLKEFAPEDIFISTGKQFEKEVREILPNIPSQNLILETEMRDTGPAVTLAVLYVHKLFPKEVLSIQWSDHLIKDSDAFITSLKRSEEIVKQKNKSVLIVVPARFPSPHRGYIQFGKKLETIDTEGKVSLHEFVRFVEKPTKEVAEEYLNDGHYGWNPGYWSINPEYYISIVKETGKETYEVCKEIVDSNFSDEALEKFRNLEKISADYMFAEHIESDAALAALVDMGWSDVGEWIAFKEAMQTSDDANVTHGNVADFGSRDSVIYNTEEGKLIATIGLDGFVVVNTKDVVAIFKKEDNTKLKAYLKMLEEDGLDKYL